MIEGMLEKVSVKVILKYNQSVVAVPILYVPDCTWDVRLIQLGVDGEPKLYWNESLSVLYIKRPVAGFEIRFRCESVNLGNSTPESEDWTSRIDEESGVVVPIPTCEKAGRNEKRERKINMFFILKL